jgi:dTDP-4-amino-4,6-dideoxygalactose transaminase
MDQVISIAERHSLKVVEDCALAIGARYKGKHVGLFGDFGCFSFYPVKHITTGEGGMFVSRHKEVAESVAKLRAFGTDRSHTERAVPGMYDVAALGLNYRMSEMQAALGRQQVLKLGEILERRQNNFGKLKSRLSEVPGITILDAVNGDAGNSHYCLTVVLQEELQGKRDQIIKGLNEDGVGTSIYYPHPVPRMTYYKSKYGYEAAKYTNAAAISDRSIALPVGPHVSDDDVGHIALSLKKAITEANS